MKRAARFLFVLLPGVVAAQVPPQPEAASGFAVRPAAAASRHMAVTANPVATQTALNILRQGGSAVDAAIAAQLVLNLVEPQSSGIGGGGFLLHWNAKRSELVAYDGRETAPLKAEPDRFSGRAFRDVVATGRSVGTPGLVAMLALAHAQHGKLPWSRLFEPAIRLADAGFVVSPRLALLIRDASFLASDKVAGRYFFHADGSPLKSGEILRNPALAGSLRLIASGGAEAFYRGRLADAIVAAVRAGGGDLSSADFAQYSARQRTPVCANYRVWTVCGMPPPSSGGLAVLQMLGILERVPFTAAAPMSAQALHWFAEAGSLAFADRRRYVGDPDYVAVPQQEMLAPAYLDRRAALLSPGRTIGSAAPGEFSGRTSWSDDTAPERPSTSHLSIVDREGNAVALTSSIEDAFGSRRMVGGFLLNNQLTDFSFQPTEEGRHIANRVGPGKRPLSSMSPTMVFDGSGRLLAVVGSPGGPRIINYVAQTLVALLDWQLAPDAALALPRIGNRNGPTEIESGSFADAVRGELEALGHQVVVGDMTSGLHVILRQGARWLGAADPRREGQAAGD